MNSARWMLLGALAITSVGLFACSSDTVTTGELGFTVAENLLVLYPEDATSGYVLLSGATGTCAALQSGLVIAPETQIANLDYVYIPLGVVDANDNPLALTAGTYNIVDPTNPVVNPPGLFAYMAVLTTDVDCEPLEQDANSGTITVSPLTTADGGSSSLSYSSVFTASSTSLTGTYALTTCLVSEATPVADAGTCAACAPAADGGPCAIQ